MLTTTAYDALGRVLSVTAPGSAVSTNCYSGNQTTTTDPAGVQRVTTVDAEGRLVSVTEAGTAVTSYKYDALDDLTAVCQGAAFDSNGNCRASGTRARSFGYDSLKRLTSAQQPESGTTTYTYDNNGNLLTSTNANQNVVTMGYDVLNRITSKAYTVVSGSATPDVTFCYDGDTTVSVKPTPLLTGAPTWVTRAWPPKPPA